MRRWGGGEGVNRGRGRRVGGRGRERGETLGRGGGSEQRQGKEGLRPTRSCVRLGLL